MNDVKKAIFGLVVIWLLGPEAIKRWWHNSVASSWLRVCSSRLLQALYSY